MIVKTGIPTPLFRRALTVVMIGALLLPAWSPEPAAATAITSMTFNGGGWGHGIGLSQYGARGYALQGWTYDRILAHYYQGTRLETKPAATVRVNLDKSKAARSQWQIQAGSDTTLTITQNSDKNVVVSLRESVGGSPAKYWITTSGGNVQLHRDASGKPGALIRAFSGRAYANSTSPIRIVGKSGPFDHSGVRWRGRLHFIPSTATTSDCINYLDIEEYLKGVVPRESPSSWPAEALKSQAVAARSYAYDDAVNDRVLWCTTMSQVYNGHSRPGYEHEPASTNAAIDATKGQLVWYGSETTPVKTYFSSSSGGHTANVQDVWLSSTPKPYYTGVPDADKDGNSNYTWSSGALTPETVSTKVRAKVGSANSAPSPYVIDDITLERAASGFTRYANIRWNNGRTYRISGDSLRSALGLKSTKFGVSIARAASPVTVYSDANTNLAWSGLWAKVSLKGAYGSSMRRTRTPGSQVVVKFKGTGVSVIGTKASSYGKSAVAIDGQSVGTIDFYSAKTANKKQLFSRTGLSDGEHTLTITALKSKNSRSSGYGASLDRVAVTGGTLLKAATPVQRYEESGGRVGELGGWKRETDAAASGGSRIANSRRGAKVVVDFVGTGIDWVAATGPSGGAAKVSIDGGTPVTVSLATPAAAHQTVVFSRYGLSATKRHLLIIEVVGPTAPSNGTVWVDRVDVTGGWVAPPSLTLKRVQESAVTKAGTWQRRTNRLASGGAHITSGKKVSSVTIAFEGTSIAWYGARTSSYGKAEVLLDGKRVAVVDTYGKTTKLNQKLWSRTGLSAKRHTLSIRPLGTKRSASKGTLVSVDAIGIRGRVAP